MHSGRSDSGFLVVISELLANSEIHINPVIAIRTGL
jgi:hypothetical protein